LYAVACLPLRFNTCLFCQLNRQSLSFPSLCSFSSHQSKNAARTRLDEFSPNEANAILGSNRSKRVSELENNDAKKYRKNKRPFCLKVDKSYNARVSRVIYFLE
jgi:hypothetical protein